MNKVKERSMTPEALRFRYASDRLFLQAKLIKLFIYSLALVSVILSVVPNIKNSTFHLGGKDIPVSFIATIVSFSITIFSDFISQYLANVKEHAILERQLYQCEITGSAFSKIEYDREMTNELNELAIRKGHPTKKDQNKKPFVDISQEISDDYSYLYLTRMEAAKTNFLLSRMYVFYWLILIFIAVTIVSLAILETETVQYLQLIIGFYPLLAPIIKNLNSCQKASSNCVKICADIDNFFADGDDSYERLARFHYYVQNIEFEMMTNRPVMYKIVTSLFSHGVLVLADGVTIRFKQSIEELKKRSLMLASGIAIPKAQDLITRKDYTLEELEKKSLKRQQYYYNKGLKEASSLYKPDSSQIIPNMKKEQAKKEATLAKPKETVKKTTTSKAKAETTTKAKTTTAKPKESKATKSTTTKSNSKTTTTKKSTTAAKPKDSAKTSKTKKTK